jgi:exodeoxyribonuclease VII small subunit
MAEDKIPTDILKMSYEVALSELEAIVRQLEDGSGGLDAGIKAYERGAMLKRHCEAKLQDAQMRVEKIVLDADGIAKTEDARLD